MRTGKRIIFMTTLLFSFFAFYSLAFAAPTYNYESNWSVTVDFVGNQPNATLLVEVWKYDANTDLLVDSYAETQTLNCNVPPTINIVGDKAFFDGSAGIDCALPSIQDIVYELTKHEYKLPEECTCKTGALVWSDVQLRPNMSKSHWENPIATMEDIQFSAPIPAQSHLRTQLEMRVDTVTAVSPFHTMPKTSNYLEGFFDELNPYGSVLYNYFNAFKANTDFLQATPNFVNGPLYISNVKPTLHIGFDPSTNEGLHGIMTDLFVDPGCFGNGGY